MCIRDRANVIWGLNSPICKTVLLSPENPEGLNHFALTVYRLVGAFLLFWLASAFLPRERVAWRDLGGLFVASLFGIQLDQILFLWGLSLTSPINVSIIATTVPVSYTHLQAEDNTGAGHKYDTPRGRNHIFPWGVI